MAAPELTPAAFADAFLARCESCASKNGCLKCATPLSACCCDLIREGHVRGLYGKLARACEEYLKTDGFNADRSMEARRLMVAELARARAYGILS